MRRPPTENDAMSPAAMIDDADSVPHARRLPELEDKTVSHIAKPLMVQALENVNNKFELLLTVPEPVGVPAAAAA
jgi:hypothetical protein